jgi:hypothetical protein
LPNATASIDVVIADAPAAWADARAVARRPAVLIPELTTCAADGLRPLAARRDNPALRPVRVAVPTAAAGAASTDLPAPARALRPDRWLAGSQFSLAELVAVADELAREG